MSQVRRAAAANRWRRRHAPGSNCAMLASADPLLPAFGIALAGLLLGALLLRLLTRQDHRTWVMARAPFLPVRTLAVGDDAWVRGTVQSAQPVLCPWFEVECVAYSYRREREHHWTTKDKDGKTKHHREWRTEHSEARAIDFELDDGGEPLLVRMAGADNEALDALPTDYETSRLRHSASVIELGAVVSVLGVKHDDGGFGHQAEVPCLVTRQQRHERVQSSASSETSLFFSAGFFAFAGGAGAAAWWLTHGDPAPLPVEWAWLLPCGLATWLPIWWLGTNNRLVRLRQQVQAAFRQVDVDLAVRAGLVPNLLTVLRAHAAHEQGLLERLARLRRGDGAEAAVAAERESAATMRSVLALHEAYPELRADTLYRDLHERLWAVEEKLAHTRQLYNDIATEWNDRISQFPANLIARLQRCRPAPWFAGDDAPLPPRLSD